MKYLAIDFGGTLAKYSVMDETGTVYERGEKQAPVDSKDHFLSFICELYQEVSEKLEIGGVAISMPGIIDDNNGLLISAGAYIFLYGMNLYEELASRIPVPVTVENDGKCGALAEVWQGNLKENQDGIVLILGTGVAGGIIKNRRVHKGKSLSAGEFSYMIVGDEPDIRSTVLYKCSVSAMLFEACMKKGIDVKKSSAYSILSMFMDCSQQVSDWSDRPEYENGMDGYQFFDLLEKNDPDIVEIYERFTKNLAHLVLNLQYIYAPEKILIGGGVSRQPRLIKDISTQCDRLLDFYRGNISNPCRLERCKFGNEANQYGALYNFLRKRLMEDE
ncbi:MAG: ROK family protein [Lachnospiraceae bacterium]|nr:ROK family protein [Lachnospiraceae bacterium]